MRTVTHLTSHPKALTNYKRSTIWYVALALPFVAMVAFAFFKPILVMPRMGLGPGFALVDQTGQRLTNEDLRGRVVLYNFTYTACVDPCPQTGVIMRQVQDRLPTMATRGLPVELMTISFDPERDTATQLQSYGKRFGADFAIWHFVTGDATLLKYVIGGGFGVYYQANEAPTSEGEFTFDPAFVLVDGAGIVRAKYRTATPDIAILQRDIELITKEAAESTGVARLAYEAAHLFVCYPK